MPPFKYKYEYIQSKTPGKHKIEYEKQLRYMTLFDVHLII